MHFEYTRQPAKVNPSPPERQNVGMPVAVLLLSKASGFVTTLAFLLIAL